MAVDEGGIALVKNLSLVTENKARFAGPPGAGGVGYCETASNFIVRQKSAGDAEKWRRVFNRI
jgi:hypothetical protein